MSSEADASEQLHFVGTRNHRAARSSSTRTCSMRREPARHASSARCASVSTVSGKLGCHLGAVARGTYSGSTDASCPAPQVRAAPQETGWYLSAVRTVRKSVGACVSTQGAAARAALRSRAQPRCGERGCVEARPGPRGTCHARRRAVRVRDGAEKQAQIWPSAPTASDDGVAAGKRSLPAPFPTRYLFAEATPALREGVLLPSAFNAAVLHALPPAPGALKRSHRASRKAKTCIRGGGGGADTCGQSK